jgi:hypothetical protein
MTCEWVELPQGGTAIVCGPRARRRKCYLCPAPGLFQCDAPRRRRTCDRYLCAVHRMSQGDDVDFCPEHARQPALPFANG